MDIYYFYNGINNIINLALKNKKYMDNSDLILNDPLVILDFQDSKNLKGGGPPIALAAKLLKNPKIQQAAQQVTKNPKVQQALEQATQSKDSSSKSKDNGDSSSIKKQNKNENNSSNKQKTKPKEKALKVLKVLFSIVYYLCLFSILPLLPFIAISYYSFKRMKTFYNKQMGTL